MQAIVKCADGGYYFSMVFGCICIKEHRLGNDQWYDYAYIVLDKTKTKLILQHEFLPKNKALEPMLLFIDADQGDWEINNLGEGGIRNLITSDILERIKINRVPHSLVQKCIQLDHVLKEHAERNIQTPQDIENFIAVSRHLHDAYIEKMVLRKDKLFITFAGIRGCKIILCFADNPTFQFHQETNDHYYWQECTILFHEQHYYLVDEDLADFTEITENHQCFSGKKLTFWIIPINEVMQVFKKVVPFRQSLKLRLAEVEFKDFGRRYTYLCPNKAIDVYDWVLVPVGKNCDLKVARIINIYETYPETLSLSFPIEKLKTVAKPYSEYNEERVLERVLLLLDKRVLDFSKVNPAFNEGVYDLLETPMGYFWLELNQTPIPMKIRQIAFIHEKFAVDCLLSIKPIGVTPDKIKTIKLLSSFDLLEWRSVDSISDESDIGWQWEKAGLTFGVTATFSDDCECEVVSLDHVAFPYYSHWESSLFMHNPKFYGFNLAWKKFVSDDDLSIDFALT